MGKFFPQERRNSRRGGAQWIFLTPAWTAVASLTPSSVEYLESNPLTRNYLSMLLPRLVSSSSSSRVSFSKIFLSFILLRGRSCSFFIDCETRALLPPRSLTDKMHTKELVCLSSPFLLFRSKGIFLSLPPSPSKY